METIWIAQETHWTIFKRLRTIFYSTITQKVRKKSLGLRIKTRKETAREMSRSLCNTRIGSQNDELNGRTT